MSAASTEKIECLNPNTGRKMNIDASVYKLFSKAIYHVLNENKLGITYTEIVKGVKKCFAQQRTPFKGSIEWYSVTVKHDMEANHLVETFMKNGKKLHRLKGAPLPK